MLVEANSYHETDYQKIPDKLDTLLQVLAFNRIKHSLVVVNSIFVTDLKITMKRDKVIFIAGLTLLCVTFLLTIAAIVLNFVKIEDSPTDEFAIVTTFNGKIRGHKRATLYNQNPYYAFKGIPYARPPVGSLRFKVL